MKIAARRNGQPFLRVAGVNLRDKERDKNGKHGLLLDFISFNHSGAGMRLGVSHRNILAILGAPSVLNILCSLVHNN